MPSPVSVDVLAEDVRRLVQLIDGDPARDVPGLRKRVTDIETVIAEYRNMKILLRGIAIGLGLTNLISLGTLITVIVKLVGGG